MGLDEQTIAQLRKDPYKEESIILLKKQVNQLEKLNNFKNSEGMKYDKWRIEWAKTKKRGQYWQVAAVLFAAMAVSLDIIEPKQDFVIIYDRLANLLDSILRFVGV